MRLVVFDLDGTLIDTAGEIADAVNLTLAFFEMAQVDEQKVRQWIGHGTGWLMRQAWQQQRAIDGDDQWGQVMQKFVHFYHDTAGSRSTPYPFVVETLSKLKELQVKCAILTNKEERFTSRVLDAHRMREHFDLVISGDSLPTKKPDPSGLQHCISELGASLGSTLFVGDSEIDIATARAADVVCWAVPYGYNMGRPIADCQPDRLIEDIRPVTSFFAS